MSKKASLSQIAMLRHFSEAYLKDHLLCSTEENGGLRAEKESREYLPSL